MKVSPPITLPAKRLPGQVAGTQRHLRKWSLVYYPNPILRTVCRPVDRFDSALRDLVQEMFSLMHLHSGIGLAGPQVAVEQRVLVCAVEGRELCLINPEVHAPGTSRDFVEACLSLPDVHISLTRPERIQVTGYDTHGLRTRFGATGLWARVIQHEIDHLNGVLMCDLGHPPDQPCGPCALAPSALVKEAIRSSRRTGPEKSNQAIPVRDSPSAPVKVRESTL